MKDIIKMRTRAVRSLPPEQEEAFTLVELLVVILIIAILSAIALPLYANQQAEAIKASLKSDVRNTVTEVNNRLVSKPTLTDLSSVKAVKSGENRVVVKGSWKDYEVRGLNDKTKTCYLWTANNPTISDCTYAPEKITLLPLAVASCTTTRYYNASGALTRSVLSLTTTNPNPSSFNVPQGTVALQARYTHNIVKVSGGFFQFNQSLVATNSMYSIIDSAATKPVDGTYTVNLMPFVITTSDSFTSKDGPATSFTITAVDNHFASCNGVPATNVVL